MVCVFHLITGVLFNIGLFPILMPIAATLFFAPDWPARWIPGGDQTRPTIYRGVSRWVLVPVASFLFLQTLLPLRHFVYPGDVLWNEQGMRWSWKVMVREKNGSITYHVTDPESQRVWQVSPHRYLTQRQAAEMSGQPDLILQLARHIADDFAARGVANVEVRAEAWVSLNGRPSALMIDPDVDLARVQPSLRAASWVLPAPGGEPIHLAGGVR